MPIYECIFLFHLNTFRPTENGRHLADDIFKGIFLNENVWIPIKFSLKFVPTGPIHNIPALIQIMAWRRPGDKPLSEPMVVSLLTHICVSRPQWVNNAACEELICRDHFVHVPSQWEMTLHCNVVCHWQGAYTKWSLDLYLFAVIIIYSGGYKKHFFPEIGEMCSDF